jgi:hypothetical protein
MRDHTMVGARTASLSCSFCGIMFCIPRAAVVGEQSFAEAGASGEVAPENEPARAGGERLSRPARFVGVKRGSA